MKNPTTNLQTRAEKLKARGQLLRDLMARREVKGGGTNKPAGNGTSPAGVNSSPK